MREVNVVLGQIDTGALDLALRAALAEKILGVSTYGVDRPISIWLDESADDADTAAVEGVAAAHDPVFLAADKTSIAAGEADMATISVSALKSGAAPVVLLVAGTPVSVTLIDGVGKVIITSADPATIPITVQNPANRSSAALSILAI